MQLQGLHHVTAITANAQANVDFYAGTLGLRLVKKTVNFDEPSVYHLYFGDELGHPGSILTFFEFPGAAPGRAGDGMIHVIRWRVGSAASLAFWQERLEIAGIAAGSDGDVLLFRDPEGLAHELQVSADPDPPLVAAAPGIPPEHALQGMGGVRAYARDPAASVALLESLGFAHEEDDDHWLLGGEERRGRLRYDPPPADRGIQGAGTVHHVAWSAADDTDLLLNRDHAVHAGAHATHIIDRQYFHSVYFREPSGVLFELASRDIGFTVDEPAEELGRGLRLPPQYEARRAELERRLTPLNDPRHAVAP